MLDTIHLVNRLPNYLALSGDVTALQVSRHGIMSKMANQEEGMVEEEVTEHHINVAEKPDKKADIPRFYDQPQHEGVVVEGKDYVEANLNWLVHRCSRFFGEMDTTLLDPEKLEPPPRTVEKKSKSLRRSMSFSGRKMSFSDGMKKPKKIESSSATEMSSQASAMIGNDPSRLMNLVQSGLLSIDDAIQSQGKEGYATIAWHKARDEFPAALFRTHHWFTTSEALLDKFIEEYNMPKDRTHLPPHLLPKSFLSWSDEAVMEVRLIVCRALAHWAKHFSGFESVRMQEMIREFAAQIRSSNEEFPEREVQIMVNAVTQRRARNYTPPISRRSLFDAKPKVFSLVDGSIAIRAIAEELTVIDSELFKRIKIPEFSSYIKDSPENQQCPNIIAMIKHTNNVCLWVAQSIVEPETPAERAEIMTAYVTLCKHLRKLGNYSTLAAVHGALSHSSVGRLRHTFARLTKSCVKSKESLDMLLAPTNNHDEYRKELTNAEGFSLPYLAIYLKDLMMADVAYKTMRDNMINVRKFNVINGLLQTVVKSQEMVMDINPDPSLSEVLLKEIDAIGTQEEKNLEKRLYNLSIEREPRQSQGKKANRAKTVNKLKNASTKVLGGATSGESSTDGTPKARPKNPKLAQIAKEHRASMPELLDHLLTELSDESQTLNRTFRPSLDFTPAMLFNSFARAGLTDIMQRNHQQLEAFVEEILAKYETTQFDHDSFRQFHSDFPLLAEFESLDVDQTGIITKDTLVEYFSKVLQLHQKLEPISFHQFSVHTYTQITDCDYCSQSLSGVVQQGLQCNDCHYNVHAACVLEVTSPCSNMMNPLPPDPLVEENEKLEQALTLASEALSMLQRQNTAIRAEISSSSTHEPPSIDNVDSNGTIEDQSFFSLLVSCNPLFASLSEVDLERLSAVVKLHETSVGEVVSSDDPSESLQDYVLCVERGVFSVCLADNVSGTRFLGAGALISPTLRSSRSFRVVSKTAGAVWMIPSTLYIALLRKAVRGQNSGTRMAPFEELMGELCGDFSPAITPPGSPMRSTEQPAFPQSPSLSVSGFPSSPNSSAGAHFFGNLSGRLQWNSPNEKTSVPRVLQKHRVARTMSSPGMLNGICSPTRSPVPSRKSSQVKVGSGLNPFAEPDQNEPEKRISPLMFNGTSNA